MFHVQGIQGRVFSGPLEMLDRVNGLARFLLDRAIAGEDEELAAATRQGAGGYDRDRLARRPRAGRASAWQRNPERAVFRSLRRLPALKILLSSRGFWRF